MSADQTFAEAVRSLAGYMNWDITEAIEDDYAGFSFELSDDNEVDLDFFLNEERVDIAVAGQAFVESEKDIPDDFSTLLMRRSDDLMYGAWTLAETDTGNLQYRLLWTLDLEHFARMPKEKLRDLIERMIDEVGEVNTLWEEGEY